MSAPVDTQALYAFWYKRSAGRGGSIDCALYHDRSHVERWHLRRKSDSRRYEWVGDIVEFRRVTGDYAQTGPRLSHLTVMP